MTIAFVVGAGGVLGSALRRSLHTAGSELFSPSEPFRWDSESKLEAQFARAVRAFADRADTADRWEVYWAAGVGTMASSEEELAPETRALELLLRRIESEPWLATRPGSIAFASSAGAVYAGSSAYIITEDTETAPTTAYAREKLRQEDLVRSFVLGNQRMTASICRISTLYGPGQALGKKQGLLAHIARSVLRNQVIHIYVPFDTVRDYIAADDAAAVMIAALRSPRDDQRALVKIVAAERPTTIAEIISVFRRIARRPPRIVTSASDLSKVYSRRVQFRSDRLRESTPDFRTSLLVGISRMMIAERVTFAESPAESVGVSVEMDRCPRQFVAVADGPSVVASRT